jgi:beta-galactosamide-alpha-2,3-sialyltransferase
MKSLFICITTLEILIAIKVIKKKKLKKKNLVLFFYNDVKNNHTKYYINRASQYFDKIIFFQLNKNRFPMYFYLINKKLKNYKYFENIFIASIDSHISHYILSKKKFKNLFTFDNGITNLNEKYNLNLEISIIKKIIYKIVGNRFSKNKVKSISKKHYTIFNQKKNSVSNNLEFVGELFKKKEYLHKVKKSCDVILIPVFRDLFLYDEKNINNYKNLIHNFIKSKKNIILMNHPREYTFKIRKQSSMYSSRFKIAEEFIIDDLLNKYKTVNIFSFPLSTVLINLIKYKNVKNFLFYSNIENARLTSGIKTAKKLKIKYKTINLSKYEYN